jgi:hypothetical protein
VSKPRKTQTREATRLVFLVRQLQREGHKLRAIANNIDVSHAFLSQLSSTQRLSIGADVINNIRKKYDVSPMYFYDDYEGEAHYRQYLGTRADGATRVLVDSLEQRMLFLADKVDALTATPQSVTKKRRKKEG